MPHCWASPAEVRAAGLNCSCNILTRALFHLWESFSSNFDDSQILEGLNKKEEHRWAGPGWQKPRAQLPAGAFRCLGAPEALP